MTLRPGEGIDDREPVSRLLQALHAQLPTLENFLEEVSSHWGYEDPVYRFYHQSFKVYALQATTERIVAALQALLPDTELNAWFLEIVRNGTGKMFTMEDNKHWIAVTRPIVEAFFHARFFLEMAVRYGRQLDAPPQWSADCLTRGTRPR